MILTSRQAKAFQQGIAVANTVLPRIEFLERLAAAYPAITERVQQLRTQRDFLLHLSETGLEADRILSGES